MLTTTKYDSVTVIQRSTGRYAYNAHRGLKIDFAELSATNTTDAIDETADQLGIDAGMIDTYGC